MSVPSLEPVEPILWKIITKHSEMNKKNKIPVALYAQLPGIHLPPLPLFILRMPQEIHTYPDKATVTTEVGCYSQTLAVTARL